MSEAAAAAPLGAIAWVDLTVPNAVEVRDFYAAVTGWVPQPVDMDGYQDFGMDRPGDGVTVAGVCHARGANAGQPAQWMIYVTVPDAETSARKAVELGGAIISGPRDIGGSRIYVIRDPAGAVLALYQTAT
ncbi:MAG TPA: VOC family protein [Candidatus Limnocylindria bacterium]|jgi:predicted enzyme related to lactoylglutathione lyase|nr:VOC family protein [Candidatus Limnocylindria bacterium]